MLGIRRRIVTTLFGIFCFFLAVAGASAQSIPPNYKEAVAFLFGRVHMRGPDGKSTLIESPLGTSFFAYYPDKRGGPDFGFIYLVTAKHVLKDTDGTFLRSIRVRLNLIPSQAGAGYGFIDVPVADDAGRLLWLHDETDQSDEAVALPLLPDHNRFTFRTIPTELFADAEYLKKNNVSEGDTIFFVGLFAQFYGSSRNFPVIRKGSLALMTDEKVPTPNGPSTGYLAEVNSWPGNSGSPVFLDLAGMRGNTIQVDTPRLLGILISFYNNVRSGETVDASGVTFGDPSNVGIAFVLPSSRVKEILDGSSAQNLRDAELSRKGILPKKLN